jgi:RNA polymerase sigma factor (sigma-70 family)
MAKGHTSNLLPYLHQLVGAPALGQPTDGELLHQFAGEGDERAFQLLLQRHGPMVLATCRRILHDLHEAEDSFQATFVVLARKARSIRKQTSLGSWLYRVAYHIAINARARVARQRAREREVAHMNRADSPAAEPSREVNRVLDEELRQLPEKYRAPLVLCYLEGKTHQQVAEELRWPTGTMSRRLARGQELLRRRMLRRGLALSVSALGGALAAEANGAALSATLLDATTKAAVLSTFGHGAVAGGAAKVASLADEAIHAMAIARIKAIALIMAAALGVVSVNAAVFWPPHEPVHPTPRDAQSTLTPSREWGEPVEGMRLRCSCDRSVYRLDKDLIRVTFALHNVSDAPQPVTFLREGQEFTDVRITDPEGKEHFISGTEVPLPQRATWGGHLHPDSVHRVSMIVDPSDLAEGLRPGRYRLRGLFRRQPTGDSPLTVADLRLESNETTFTLLPPMEALQHAGATGPQAGGCSLGLVADRGTWKPGDPPLSIAVVLHRADDDLRTLRFLQANRLGMYYHLEITGPGRGQRFGLQPPWSAGVDPRTDPFAHHRLMFLQLERIPVGKGLGERLEWDPSGDAERQYRREPVIRQTHWGAGRYTIRAIYQLREQDQQVFGENPAAIRLVSNPIEIQIGE